MFGKSKNCLKRIDKLIFLMGKYLTVETPGALRRGFSYIFSFVGYQSYILGL